MQNAEIESSLSLASRLDVLPAQNGFHRIHLFPCRGRFPKGTFFDLLSQKEPGVQIETGNEVPRRWMVFYYCSPFLPVDRDPACKAGLVGHISGQYVALLNTRESHARNVAKVNGW